MQSNKNNKIQSLNILDMICDLIEGNKKALKLLKNNYKELIDNRDEGFLFAIVETLLESNYTKSIVESNMLYNLLVAEPDEFKELINLEVSEQVIKENFEELINNIGMRKIFILVWKLRYLTEEQKKLLNKVLENNKIDYLKYLLASKIHEMKIKEKDLNIFLDIISRIVDELLFNEKKDIIEMKFLNSGAYSVVFQIGNKVLKIGEERETYNIPYNKRLLQPIIRVNLKDISNIKGTIEVSDKVDTNINLSDEQLYELYKELRQQGIIFSDIKNSNLGILLNKNEKHWNKDIASDHKAEGIIFNDEEDNLLDKGDIVIIDTDFIYSADDKNIFWPQAKAHQFERRYQKETIELLNLQKKKLKQIKEKNLMEKQLTNFEEQSKDWQIKLKL